MDIIELSRVLDQHGLICRGGFHPDPSDGLPESTQAVLLIGNPVSLMQIAMGKTGKQFEGVDSNKNAAAHALSSKSSKASAEKIVPEQWAAIARKAMAKRWDQQARTKPQPHHACFQEGASIASSK